MAVQDLEAGLSLAGEAPTNKRVALVILGMHRSGTSAATRVLSLLGADLPRSLVAASESNQAGHWEPRPVCELNDEILTSLGTTWRGWESIEQDWMKSPKAEEFAERAHSIITSEYGHSHLFALKDPRMCRLLPFWRSVLHDIGVAPRVVFCVRHPAEVARSLKARDGIEVALGHLLWLRNNLDAEQGSRGLPRAFLSYDSLLDNWSASIENVLNDLALVTPKTPRSAARDVEQFLRPGLRHHTFRPGLLTDAPGEKWFGETWHILSGAAQSVLDEEDQCALDRVASELESVEPAFYHLIALGEFRRNEAARAKAAEEKNAKELGDATARISALAADGERARAQDAAELGTLRAHILSLETENRALETKTHDLQRALDETRRRSSAADEAFQRERLELNGQIELLRSRHDEAIASASHAEKLSTDRIASLEDQLSTLIEKVRVLETEKSAASQTAATALAQAGSLQAEVRKLESEGAEFRARAADRTLKIVSQLEKLFAATTKKLDQRTQELTIATKRLLTVEHGQRKAQRRADQLAAQVAELAELAQSRNNMIADLTAERKELKRGLQEAKPGWFKGMRRVFSRRRGPSHPPGVTVDFDPDFYAAHYSDVTPSGLSPKVHFEKIGRAEGRLPCRGAQATSSGTKQ